MSEFTDYIEHPGVPGGKIAMSELAPDYQAQLREAQAAGFSIPAPVDPMPQAWQRPPVAPSELPSLPVSHAINDAKAGGFELPITPLGLRERFPTMTDAEKMALAPEVRLALIYGKPLPGENADTPAAPPSAPTAPQATQTPPAPDSGGPMGTAVKASMSGTFPMMSGGGGVSGAGLKAAYKDSAQAIDQQTNALRAQNQVELEGAQQKADFLKEQAEEERQSQEAQKASTEEGWQKLQQAQTELEKPAAKIDPNRYWADKGGATKVTALVAVAMGGIGTALQGRAGNPALDIINRQIDQDIHTQEQDIANDREQKRDRVMGARNLLEAMRQKLGDERAAKAAVRNIQLGALEQQITAQMGKTKDEATLANGSAAKAAIGIEREKNLADFNYRNAQLGLERMKIGLSAMEVGLKAGKGQEKQKVTAGEASKIGNLDGAIKMINDIGDAHSKLGAGSSLAQWFGSSKSAQYRDQLKVAAQVIGGILEDGKLTDPDYARYKEMMPAPGDFSATALNKVKSIAAILQTKRDSQVAALGQAGFEVSGFPVSTAQKRDKYGAVGQ